MINDIINEFKKLNEVHAIALGGSRATGHFEEDSDYDIYVYTTLPIEEDVRRSILSNHVLKMEYSNHFWELEDDGILKSNIEIELIYRNIKDFTKMISPLQINHGYTTAFIDNVLTCEILYEKDQFLTNLKEKLQGILTNKVINQIVEYNFPIIKDRMPSLYNQVKKAVDRNDLHSINHRLSEYFAIYHDILFAINKEYHKGEKRLLKLTESFKHKPKNQKSLIANIYYNAYQNPKVMVKHLKALSKNLELLLKELNYI